MKSDGNTGRRPSGNGELDIGLAVLLSHFVYLKRI